MMEQNQYLEKFDPSEWDDSERISDRVALETMLSGGVIRNLDNNGKHYSIPTGIIVAWDSLVGWHMADFPVNGNWVRVVRKPKPTPSKPAEPAAEAILNALREGKLVVDADGDEVAICYRTGPDGQWIRNRMCIPKFPLTIKPEPKPRRRVTREEAIIVMVRDPEQHAWDDGGLEYRMQKGCHLQMQHATIADKVGAWMHTSMSHYNLYLDPPEVAK